MVGVAILALVENVPVLLLANIAFDGLEVGYFKELDAGIGRRCRG
jgi:hypothetical protein